jgi:hypothetical protein
MFFQTAWFLRTLGFLAFCLCGHCIAYSSNPIVFIALAAVAACVFFVCRGSAIPVFILTAIGPLVNCTAFYCDPYVYNSEVVILTYLGGWFWKNAGDHSPEKPDAISVAYGTFLIFLLVATAIHIVLYSKNIPAEIRLARVFLIGGFLLAFLRSIDRMQMLVYYKTALLTILFISMAGLGELCVRGILARQWGPEPHSVFNGSEMLALYLCTTIPFILSGKPVLKKGIWSCVANFTVLTAVVLLLMTRSRTGILSLLIFLLFYGLRFIRLQPRKTIHVLIAIGFPLLAAICVAGAKTFHGGNYALRYLPEQLFSSRVQAWPDGIKSFITAPLWGSGSGYNVYNLYLQILCNQGIVVFAAFFVFIGLIFFRYHNNKIADASSPLHYGLLWSVVVLLIAGVGESAIGNQLGYYILFLIFLAGNGVKLPAAYLPANSQNIF